MNYNDLGLVFKALSSEIRLQIIEMLTDKEMCACKILDKFNITQPTLSHHMRILTECNLVLDRKVGKWIYYHLNKDITSEIEKYFRILNHENC